MATLNLTKADLERLCGSVPGLEALAAEPVEPEAEALTTTIRHAAEACNPNARITKQEFFRDAMGFDAVLSDKRVDVQPKLFSTGSVGWRWNGKGMVYLMNGQEIEVQINLNVTAVGSKDWPTTRVMQ